MISSIMLKIEAHSQKKMVFLLKTRIAQKVKDVLI